MIAAVLSKVGRLWTDYTTARAAKLDYLDAGITSRTPDKGQKVMSARLGTTSTTYVTLLNVSGAGILNSVAWQSTGAYLNYLRVTIDGQAAQEIAAPNYNFRTATDSGVIPILARYKTSCLVEVCNSSGSTASYYNALYSLDI